VRVGSVRAKERPYNVHFDLSKIPYMYTLEPHINVHINVHINYMYTYKYIYKFHLHFICLQVFQSLNFFQKIPHQNFHKIF
jgi:hypothetical protein